MPNSYFQFQQFTINQGLCAMKVTTDACLFGAWAAETMQKARPSIENVLDIGAGTGLLSLMLAQKIPANYDAIEIDGDAYQQCKSNFETANLPARLTAYLADASHFRGSPSYQLIISNPPFYKQSLLSPSAKKNLAHHSTALSFETLIHTVNRNLHAQGLFALLLPQSRHAEFVSLATTAHLYPIKCTLVKQTPQHPPFRCMLLFAKKYERPCFQTEMCIKAAKAEYSTAFTYLLKDYYLKNEGTMG